MTHIQPARGNAAKNDAVTLHEGVITVDTTNKSIRVHDGATAGGVAMAKAADLNGKLPASGGTATDTQLNGMRVRAAPAQSGTAFAVNYANGDYFKLTATGNTTVTLSNFPTGLVACGVIEAVNWGGKTITFQTGTKIVGGSLSLTASGTDLLGLVWDGATMRVTLMAKDVK